MPQPKAMKAKKLIRKNTLRSALVNSLKAQTGRKDIKFEKAPELAATTQKSVPIKERAGYPLVFPKKDPIDPKDWKTHNGVKIEVDFNRCSWLPDDWGQGVKMTEPNSRSTNGGGGILTCFVGPDMKNYFHKTKVEERVGRSLTEKDGWNGQVRLAKLQAMQAIQLARQQVKQTKSGGSKDLIGTDSDEDFFKILSPAERKQLPRVDEFHFGVVSARRARTIEGVRDIFMVQCQLQEAGITPTWYVDEGSVKEYQALGLNAVVGGKLTPSRNKALRDARSKGKVCVQLSDDISAWEYREGKNAASRDDDLMNAAHARARRFIISPSAAARFMIAKMRSCDNPKPKLGGVYMIGSCARTFAGEAFSRYHFILGDFFVVDVGSKVNFDEEMCLKEDYDFACAHIKAHGSVLRCNRMTLNVKHYDNGGGACTNRDKKGKEEKRNIDILCKKWPGCFRPNPKRQNEVIMRWKDLGDDAEDDGEEHGENCKHITRSVKKTITKQTSVKKLPAKSTSVVPKDLKPNALLKLTGKEVKASYIANRCKRASGQTVKTVLESKFKDEKGESRPYRVADLRYDLERGYLTTK